jgi:hypothetical protein
MQESGIFVVHRGYIKSLDDLDELTRRFSLLGKAADKPRTDHTDRQLWFSLTGCSVCKNIYRVPMPFLVKVICKSCTFLQAPSCHALVLPDKAFSEIGIPSTKQIKESVFLVSGTLCLQIKDSPEDKHAKKVDIWVPSRDFNMIGDDLPSICYVELFLDQLKYVSEIKADSTKPSLFDYMLSKNSFIQQKWTEFVDTFTHGELQQ